MRKITLLSAILAFAVVAVMCASTFAEAATPKHSITVHVGLSVNCNKLPTSGQALKVLADRHICGLGVKNSKVHQGSSISGNCGTLSLNLYDDGGGVMLTQVVVTSYWYLGPIYKFIWSGAWWNNDTQSGGAMGDVVFGTGYTRTSDTYYYTDYGSVVGSLTYAEDQTIFGITCTNVDSLGAWVYI